MEPGFLVFVTDVGVLAHEDRDLGTTVQRLTDTVTGRAGKLGFAFAVRADQVSRYTACRESVRHNVGPAS